MKLIWFKTSRRAFTIEFALVEGVVYIGYDSVLAAFIDDIWEGIDISFQEIDGSCLSILNKRYFNSNLLSTLEVNEDMKGFCNWVHDEVLPKINKFIKRMM